MYVCGEAGGNKTRSRVKFSDIARKWWTKQAKLSITIQMKLYLVYLSYNSIKNLSFERSEHDGFVLHRIHNKSLARLYKSSSNVVNGSYSYYKTIPITTFSYTVLLYIGHKS
jgi:hypothetical protein